VVDERLPGASGGGGGGGRLPLDSGRQLIASQPVSDGDGGYMMFQQAPVEGWRTDYLVRRTKVLNCQTAVHRELQTAIFGFCICHAMEWGRVTLGNEVSLFHKCTYTHDHCQIVPVQPAVTGPQMRCDAVSNYIRLCAHVDSGFVRASVILRVSFVTQLFI